MTRKLGGNFLLEPAAAMVHMLSWVMYALCSPRSLTNKWDTEVPYTRKIAILSTLAMVTQVWNPCAPLLLCTVGSDTQVWNPCALLLLCTVGAMLFQGWNPCAPSLLCTVGSDHQGVEPLCPFTTEHCRQ